jgi:hypothetical protein
MQGLEATNMLLKQISDHYKASGDQKTAREFKKKADEMIKRSKTIHDFIFTQHLLSEDKRFEL